MFNIPFYQGKKMVLLRKIVIMFIIFLMFSSYNYTFLAKGNSLVKDFDNTFLLDGARVEEKD